MTISIRSAAVVMTALILVTGCSLTPAQPSGWNDAELETRIRKTVSDAMPGRPLTLEIKIRRGAVTLTGHATPAESEAITELSRGVRGVRTVKNQMRAD